MDAQVGQEAPDGEEDQAEGREDGGAVGLAVAAGGGEEEDAAADELCGEGYGVGGGEADAASVKMVSPRRGEVIRRSRGDEGEEGALGEDKEEGSGADEADEGACGERGESGGGPEEEGEGEHDGVGDEESPALPPPRVVMTTPRTTLTTASAQAGQVAPMR